MSSIELLLTMNNEKKMKLMHKLAEWLEQYRKEYSNEELASICEAMAAMIRI